MSSAGKIKVSVIIPIYKVEAYIAECLESVVNQSLKEIEILCIDDASPDGSADVARRFAAADPRIKLYFNESNQGVAAARNRGLELARGQYIYVIDSDDFLRVDAIEKLYECASQRDLDLVLSDACKYHADGTQEFYPHPYHGVEQRYWGGHAAWWFLFRRDLIIDNPDIRFPIGAHPMEDTTFSFMLFTFMKQHGYVSEPLLYYRQHANMCMARTHGDLMEQYLVSMVLCFDYLCGFMIRHPRESRHRQEACISLISNLVEEAVVDMAFDRSRLTGRTRRLRGRFLIKRFLFLRKVTRSGKCVIKICKIPILYVRLNKITNPKLRRWFTG